MEQIFLLIFIIPIIGICALYFFKAIESPFLIVVLVALSSLLGAGAHLAQGGLVAYSFFQVSIFFAWIILFLNRVYSNNFNFIKSNLEFELLLFLSLVYFSIIYSPNRFDAIFQSIRMLALISLIYLFLNTVLSQGKIHIILWSICILAFVLAGLSTINSLFNLEETVMNALLADKGVKYRATGDIGDPSKFAALFFIPISFVFVNFLVNKRNLGFRIFNLGLFFIFNLTVVLTYSRSAWVSIIFALLLIIFLFRDFKIIGWLVLGGIISVIFVPNIQYILVVVFERFLDIFAGSQDDSSNARILLGTSAISMFLDSYMLGIGFRGFPAVLPYYVSPIKTIGVVEPHNLYYTILTELGLIGFLLFVWILYKVGSFAYQNFKKSRTDRERILSATLLSSYTTTLIFYQFYPSGITSKNLWMITALILCMRNALNRIQHRTHSEKA